MKPQQRINIELKDEAAEGTYSNLVMISHSPSEIILDFIRVMPGMQKGKVFSRIIMTPAHAKMFMEVLQDNIKKFESQFGQIKIHGKEQKNIGFETSASSDDSQL